MSYIYTSICLYYIVNMADTAENAVAAIAAQDYHNLDLLTCQICKDTLKDPYYLDKCMHVHCKACIMSMPKVTREDVQGYICPQCQTFSTDGDLKSSNLLVALLAVEKCKIIILI